MLIIAILLFGMLVGAAAQWALGRSAAGVDWSLAVVAGLVGSFIGGLLISLLSGDGLELQAGGLLGSFFGAVVVTAGWQWWRSRSAAAQ